MKTERVIAQLKSVIQRNIEANCNDLIVQHRIALSILYTERILELEKENAKLRRQLRGKK